MGETPELDRVRRVALPATLLLASVVFAWVVHGHRPIQDWLFFRYAWAWLCTLLFSLSCLAAGNALLARCLGPTLPLVERLTLGFAVGVFAFGLSVFVLGVAGLVHAALALPFVFLGLGARRLRADFLRVKRHVFHSRMPKLGAVGVLAVLAGAVGVGVLYGQALSPEVMSFDVRWYHAPLAQRYALSGAITRLEEGFWLGAYPQLLTYLYTWVFLIPGSLFGRLATCQSLETLLFIATLAQIPVLLRRLLPEVGVRLSFLSLLCFPGIYLYDSNLHGGADHFAAFFAIPIALAALRSFRAFTVPRVLLLAVFLSAAALTKYSAICIVLPPALALFGHGLYLAIRRPQSGARRALGVLLSASLLLTAPHWLKNWIFYGDPLYPMLHAYLGAHPFHEDAVHDYVALTQVARSAPPTLEGLSEALAASVTFSFIPNNWTVLHRDWPVFGSLFTLTLPCLPFLKGAKRLVPLYAAAMSAVVVWFFLNHFDRLLRPVVPWMAVATAGALALAWRRGRTVRLTVAPLVALQCIWGLDVPFFRTHNLIHDSSLRHSAALLASGFEQKSGRFRVFEPFFSIGASLPPDAVVLVHDQFRILGLDRNWVTDRVQGRINYGRLLTPAAIHRELVELDVTHVLFNPDSVARDSLAGDLAFLNYATSFTVGRKRFDDYTVARLSPKAPLAKAGNGRDAVAVFGCRDRYGRGLYELRALALPDSNPALKPEPPLVRELDLEDARKRARFMVVDPRCAEKVEPGSKFRKIGTRGKVVLYARKT